MRPTAVTWKMGDPRIRSPFHLRRVEPAAVAAYALVAERSPAATLINCTDGLASVPPSVTSISYRIAAADELMNRKGELLFTRIKTYSIRMERGN